jgi:hypothetical protein
MADGGVTTPTATGPAEVKGKLTETAPLVPGTLVGYMRGNRKIDSAADNEAEGTFFVQLFNEMLTQAQNLGYDLGGKVSMEIQGEPVVLSWTFSRLKKGATG